MRRSNLVTRGIILSAIAAMALGAAVSADDTTLEFQQWWGVELPDGALQEICDGFTEETGVKIDLLNMQWIYRHGSRYFPHHQCQGRLQRLLWL